MKSPWQTVSSKEVYTNPWLSVHEHTVIRPDGTKGMYGVVDTYGPSVFIVAMNDMKQVLYVAQHRFPTNTYSWELPGGNAGAEDVLKAAQRELEEESGYRAEKWDKVGVLQVMSGVSNELEHIFVA